MKGTNATILNIFRVLFPEIRIYPRQIPVFRGAVASWAETPLFHNHLDTSQLSYRYPLIQYRSVEGRGCIYGFQEGTHALQQVLFRPGDHKLMSKIGQLDLNYYSIVNERHELNLTENWIAYYLNDWLALNADNYLEWKQNPRLVHRVGLLENVLTAHLLSFASGIGWRLPEGGLQVELMDIYHHRKVKVHGTDSIAFNIRYRSNLNLPDGIALGRAVSHGFGVQNRMLSASDRILVSDEKALLEEVNMDLE
jgi:hypothetical protein